MVGGLSIKISGLLQTLTPSGICMFREMERRGPSPYLHPLKVLVSSVITVLDSLFRPAMLVRSKKSKKPPIV